MALTIISINELKESVLGLSYHLALAQTMKVPVLASKQLSEIPEHLVLWELCLDQKD